MKEECLAWAMEPQEFASAMCEARFLLRFISAPSKWSYLLDPLNLGRTESGNFSAIGIGES